MNLQWLASPDWANIVKALLHTLWQGAVVAVLLGFGLRRLAHPVTRYRCSLAALGGILLAGIVTWAVLNRPLPQKVSAAPAPSGESVSVSLPENSLPPLVVNVTPPQPSPVTLPWSAWLAMLWLAGATAMIFRAGFQVAGAERLRRSARPLEDASISGLLEDARRAVGLARRVRVVATDKLTSPAVVGVLVPTLILPLTLLSTLTPEQIRFVLLHELAHIRRGDYFASLFQLFVEALLFFNPAVWWISRQTRIEREACCDALAIELSGAPADYARTLVSVAENVLSTAPLVAPAFGDQREPSSLADRVQRMLVPGYRPALRLTWRAMLVALFVGTGLLFLSALGTSVTVAAILSPQQRIERIEKKMTELGEKPEVENEPDSSERVTVVVHVRTADGTPLHKERSVTVHSKRRNSSGYYGGWLSKDGWGTNKVQAGEMWVEANVKGYAPAVVGPFDGRTTNFVDAGEIVLDKGFEVQLRATDAKTGAAITNANLQIWLHHIPTGDSLQGQRNLKTDADGKATMTYCIPHNLQVTANAPGYEITQTTFEKLSAGQTLELKLHPGVVVTGTVTDKLTGNAIAGAHLQIIFEEGSSGSHHDWGDKLFHLATTGADGHYAINQLSTGTKYVLGISAPGHESVMLKPFTALAPRELPVALGPELIVRGQVSGVITQLQQINQDYCLSRNFSEEFEQGSYGHHEWVPLRVTNGVGWFVFTNRTVGKVTLSGAGVHEERVITAPVADWNLTVAGAQLSAAKKLPTREVIFRFKNPSGVSPRGTVRVRIPNDEDPKHYAVSQKLAVTNGEVRVKIPIGESTDIEPERMIGYMFNRTGEWQSPTGEHGDWMNIHVGTNLVPLVIDIPLLPAGAIYARAKNADGTPAGGLFFGVTELKKAPGRDHNGLNDGDSISGTAPRQWVSGALPLGGTYQIHGWRGNSFCVSKPVKLTEANPDAEVELQFPPGKTFNGVVLGPDGQPLREVEMKAGFSLADNHSFGLKKVFADEHGQFQLKETTPDLGTYSVEFSAPGLQVEMVKLDFGVQPQVIRLKRGRTLAGQVIDSVSGQPIPGMEVRALDYESNKLPMQTTHTDEDGHFEFNSLGDANYTLYPDGGELLGRPASGNLKFRADGRTNLTLKVKLYEWSQLKPKGIVTNAVNATLAEMNRLRNPRANDATIDLSVASAPVISSSRTNAAEQDFTLTFKLDDSLREDTLRRALLDAGVKMPPTFFFYSDGGILLVRGSLEQLAFVNRAVLKMNGASTAEAEAGSIRLIQRLAETAATNDAPTNLFFTRTFKVDTQKFADSLLKAGTARSGQSGLSAAARNFFMSLGVDFENPPGKTAFYSDKSGVLLVRATAAELAVVEKAVEALNYSPPQVHIKARFLEMPKGAVVRLGASGGSISNVVGGFTAISSSTNAQAELRAMAAQKGFENLGEPEVVTTSGRQCQMRTTQILTIVTNVVFEETATNSSIVYQTGTIETGPVFDVVPHVLADGYTITLNIKPSLTEFLGYDTTNITTTVYTKKGERIDLPRILPNIRKQQLSATVSLWDGQTAILGGLTKINVIKTKVPLLGDVPVVSRLFRSKRTTESDILVFISATIVDPAGNRVHADDELPFAQTGIPPQPK